MARGDLQKVAEKTVAFKYIKDERYQEVFVNGVFGGISPRGDLRFDLFQEYVDTPEKVIHKLSEGITLGDEVERIPTPERIVRVKRVGITMTTDSAESVARWILSKVDEYKQMLEREQS